MPSAPLRPNQSATDDIPMGMLALALHPSDRSAPASKSLLAYASAVPTPWRTSAMIAAAVGRTVTQLGRSGSTRAVSGHAAAEMAAGRLVTTPTDESLLEAHLKGDEEAFTTLVDRYSVELVPFLTRLTGSRAAAEDVFQDTFLQIHQSGHTFDLARRFRPWMYTIAVNKGRDWHRRNSRRKALSLSAPMGKDDGVSFVDLLASDVESPDTPLTAVEEASAVKRVVDALPEHQREIILLSYFQQMSYNQIAETLRIPLGTVKSRLHSAIAAFARAWEIESGAGKDAS